MKIIPDTYNGIINFAVHSESSADDALMDILYEQSKRNDLEFCIQGSGKARGSCFFCFGHVNVSTRKYVLKSNDNYLTPMGLVSCASGAKKFTSREEAAFYLADKKRGVLEDWVIELYVPA